MLTKTKIEKARNRYVAKANIVIRKSRYKHTVQQERILLYAISKIQPNDLPGTEYEFSIEELCALCDIDEQAGGYYYRTIKEDLLKLAKPFWLTMEDGTEKIVRWIDTSTILPLCGTITVRFNETIQPYLFQLKAHYTQYRLAEVLKYRCPYTIRLHELLISYTTEKALIETPSKKHYIRLSLGEINKLLSVRYKTWGELNLNVLIDSIKEINLYNEDMQVTYSRIVEGRKTVGVNFIVQGKTAAQKYITRQHLRERPNKGIIPDNFRNSDEYNGYMSSTRE